MLGVVDLELELEWWLLTLARGCTHEVVCVSWLEGREQKRTLM